MEDLITYFEEKLKITAADLLMDESDRMILVGQLDMLEQIKEIYTSGYPSKEDNIDD